MPNNLHYIDQPDHLPDAPAGTHSARNIDAVVNSLIRLKGMFGAIVYLINPDGTKVACPSEHFEAWFMEIQDKLDDMVGLLSEA